MTDNGMAFADLPKYRDGPTARWMGHIFDRVCREHGIEHRLTKPYHLWTNGQAERMNRIVKDATIKAFHYPGLEALEAHVLAFVRAYNFAKHLTPLRWRPPFEAICDAWAKDRSIFKINPHHLIPGPNTVAIQTSMNASISVVSGTFLALPRPGSSERHPPHTTAACACAITLPRKASLSIM
jgi:hypothetical protein